MSDGRLRLAIALVAVLGLGVAGYLTYVHYRGIHVLCLASGGCETVQASDYAKLAGVPVALLGLIGYAGILTTVLLPVEAGVLGAVGLSSIGFGFSAYLTYREVFTIKAICQWCVASAVLMTLLLGLTLYRALRPPEVSP